MSTPHIEQSLWAIVAFTSSVVVGVGVEAEAEATTEAGAGGSEGAARLYGAEAGRAAGAR